MSAINRIIQALRARERPLSAPYYVPGLWVDPQNPAPRAVNPYRFYAERLAALQAAPPQPLTPSPGGGTWTRHAVIYNLFPRVAAAYDHAHDGHLSLEASPEGWRETGTLLKSIVLLPYIRSLGADTVYLLPITTVGQDGKKGTLGSPYAIRNPYKLDHNLAEPALGLGPDALFAGFVQAAHHLGMRVVMEFVLRTASKDADWIGEHPQWFYWIREDVRDRVAGSDDPTAYGPPIFSAEELASLKAKVARGNFTDLTPPPAAYRAMFTPPPKPEQVRMENGRWVGTLEDGTRVRVPGAFADWPPDDNQPPWTDVTYLRMYDHPDFNYIAYNTIRMYDTRLARPENAVTELWESIVGVIPHYQQTFGIDGVMMDMGHALPMPLKQRIVAAARALNPDFAFWDENFTITAKSVEEGYNAVLGYMLFDFHQPPKLRAFFQRLAQERLPLPFFATAENHNTPRAASRPAALEYVHYALILSVMVPGVPFIHNGFELLETKPINTGLGFDEETIRANPPETLPLFSAWAFHWTREGNLVGSIRYALELRRRHAALLSDPDPATFLMGHSDNPHLLVFARHNAETTLWVIANTSAQTTESGTAHLPVCNCALQALWGAEGAFNAHSALKLPVTLKPYQVLVLEGGAELPPLGRATP